MIVLHAVWTAQRFHLWAESLERWHASATRAEPGLHPFAATEGEIIEALEDLRCSEPDPGTPTTIEVCLPGVTRTAHGGATPLPSVSLRSMIEDAGEVPGPPVACRVRVPALRLAGSVAWRILQQAGAMMQREPEDCSARFAFGHDVRWWVELGDLAGDLLMQQRFIPSLIQTGSAAFEARWRPWTADAQVAERFALLCAAMPAAARCAGDAPRDPDQGWKVADAALESLVDGFVRDALGRERFIDALADHESSGDAHVAWLGGLLDGHTAVVQPAGIETSLLRQARGWLTLLDEPADVTDTRLRFVLEEPESEQSPWCLRFELVDRSGEVVARASAIWGASGRSSRRGARHEELGELLLSELARASHVWPTLEASLEESHPEGLELDTQQAYEFLTDTYPLLAESGFAVSVPAWWGAETHRIGARLALSPVSDGIVAGSSPLGLESLVEYQWKLSVGDTALDAAQFEALVRSKVPLVRVGDRWVEVRAADLGGAIGFLKQHPGGTMTLLEALRLASGVDASGVGIPVTGFDATGWINDVFGTGASAEKLSAIEQPAAFRGDLRPYQRVGLSWLAFLNRHGIGAILADDMGLGKTIQLIALLQHERSTQVETGPTLLVAPLSVLGNWRRELERFAPEIRVHTQHGLDRPTGDRFRAATSSHDVILTTYAIAVRDRELLASIRWERVVLDEAQHIKNPPTKQTAAIRSLTARHRVALTGTPVENRLAELWSILEFCCPGYLGTRPAFQRSFAIPIERHRDAALSDRLRTIVRPFILRRLKTDPKVIDDLPDLLETKEFVGLTTEQGALYQSVVRDMLTKVEATDGIRRRGLILSSLVRLKQICNHPAHYLAAGALQDGLEGGSAQPNAGDEEGDASTASLDLREAINRSDKLRRLVELLEEVIANGHRALVFTQYRQMGHLLVPALAKHLDIDPLFLHGGTPHQRRDELVARFQSEDTRCPVFVLSLKAGGTGLNLTAANHVFHFDRWWNPAVENQATDRAFRIGQRRAVHVHKFVVRGTLEERIDEMIEKKSAMASSIITAGDAWITELDTGQLRDLLLLRDGDSEDGE